MAGVPDDGRTAATADRALDQVVDFGWEPEQPLEGRRAKAAKDKKRKLKPGSFGASPTETMCLQWPALGL